MEQLQWPFDLCPLERQNPFLQHSSKTVSVLRERSKGISLFTGLLHHLVFILPPAVAEFAGCRLETYTVC